MNSFISPHKANTQRSAKSEQKEQNKKIHITSLFSVRWRANLAASPSA
jgi:hypothetical protein